MTGEAKDLEQAQRELEHELNELIEDTIRQEWLRNTLIWLSVVLGSFGLVILLLVVVTGG